MKIILGEEITNSLDALAAFAQEILFDEVVRTTPGPEADDHYQQSLKYRCTVRLFADAKAAFGAAGVQIVGDTLDYVCRKHAADEAAYAADIAASESRRH